MKNIDLEYVCTVIGNLSGIPIRLFRDGEMILYHSIVNLPSDPFTLYKKDVFSVKSNLGYYVTPFFDYYGIVNSTEYKIVIGPTRQIPINERDLRKLAFELDVAKDSVGEFISSMKAIITMPLESVMQMLCIINYILNGEKKSLGDVSIYDSSQSELKSSFEKQKIDKKFDGAPEIHQLQENHNTLALEESIMRIVRKGDTAALYEWVKNAPAVRGGILAENQIRQMKNTFIVSVTLVSRSAIRGGMDTEDALSLSDAYIQRCEIMNSIEDITNLQYRMVVDFTEQVEKVRLGKNPSKLVTDVANYVHHHLSEPVKTEDIAKFLYMSRSRLSTKFKEEAGINLNDFILQEKAEEAKRLLRYTDKSLSAVSSYLGFSSQSHFTRVFKSYTQKTPKEYRDSLGK
ncbi:MAG: helix-turn-helix domain-containing protein [Eubacteriales bacterium]